jgi:hypothetical protein
MYDRVLEEAIVAFKARHWTKARLLFERAHELSPSARTLRGIGVSAYEGGDYAAAIHALEAALVHPERQLPPDLREGTALLVQQARERVSMVGLVLEPSDALVRCDGRVTEREPDGSLMLDLGVHLLTFEAPGFTSSERNLTVHAGQSASLRITLVRESANSSMAFVREPASEALAPTTALPKVQLDEQQRDALSRPDAASTVHSTRRMVAYGTSFTTLAAAATAVALLIRGRHLNQRLHDVCDAQPSGCDASYAGSRQATIERYERGFNGTVAVSIGAGLTSAALWTVELIQRRH